MSSLCPILALSMALQFIDKGALPAASILGIVDDLHVAGEYQLDLLPVLGGERRRAHRPTARHRATEACSGF